MGDLHDFRLRHNKFVENLQSYIESTIDDNQDLLNLNREQLKDDHTGVDDKPIKPSYSKGYAAFKGFKTPDIFLTGETQRTLTIEANKDQYFINGHTEQVPKLIEWYGELFGIGKKRQGRAKQITTALLAKQYKEAVYKNS